MNTRKIFGCGAHYLLSGMLAVIFALALSACGDGSETDDTGKKPVSGVTPTGGTGDTPWTWTAVADSTIWESDYGFDTCSINAIAYGNNRWVAGGAEGKMAYSDDGVNWTAVADSKFVTTVYNIPPYRGDVNAIAYGNNRWVAVGQNDLYSNGGQIGIIAYSDDDGVTWTAAANSTIWDFTYSSGETAADIKAIAYGNGKWVAVGAMGSKMAYSTDNGETWTAVANSTFSSDYYAITNIAYGNGRFVAVGDEGKMAYSDDGTTWTAVADSTIWNYTADYSNYINTITAITYDNNRWVAGGREGKIAYSDDNGVTWTAVANSTIWDYTNSYGDTAAFEIKGIAYGGDKFVAVGGAVMAYADW